MCLPLICCCVLSACASEAPPDIAASPPEVVVLAIPDRYLQDVPSRPMARGDTLADVAAYIAAFEAIVAQANDQFLAARRIQTCHRLLIDGAVEACLRNVIAPLG